MEMQTETASVATTAPRSSSHRMHIFSPASTMFQKTSQTPCITKTPRCRKLIASTRRTTERATIVEEDYTALLQKTWRIFSLSPLYKFKKDKVALGKYARSLDAALPQAQTNDLNSTAIGSEKSCFAVYNGLNFHSNDAEAIQIQIMERNNSERGSHTVLTAFLVCVDIETTPVAEHLKDDFTYYPVLMVAGNKGRTDVLLNWLERHFDCRSSPVTFSDRDLRWMLALWSSQVTPSKGFPVLMQYGLGPDVDGIRTIDCKFEATFCKELWERIHGPASRRDTMNEEEVDKFVTALEDHLEYTMHIVFSKLNLTEVGTSVAYVSSQGKLKIFSSAYVYLALHLVCEIINDRFLEMSFPST